MSVLRVATQNLWGAREPLEERLRAIGDELDALGVDAVALQEVAPCGETTSAHRLAERLGGTAVVSDRAQAGFGLAVVTREPPVTTRETPLVAARAGEPRRLLSAEVRPELWLHVTHLDYRRTDGLWRERQVVAIWRAIAAIPGDALHILCGDMNAEPCADEMRFLRGETTLDGERAFFQDAWLRHHRGDLGETWSQESGEDRARRTIDVDRRLDYIYVSERRKDGRGTVRSCSRIGWGGLPGALASDHAAVWADIDCGDDGSAPE